MTSNNNYPILKINHVFKTFNSNHVLRNISLEINKGDIYGILGLSGAGKSTLVRCINGLEKIDFGEILYYPEENNEIILTSNEFNINQLNKEYKKYQKKLHICNKKVTQGNKHWINHYEKKIEIINETLDSIKHDIEVQKKYGSKRNQIIVSREYKKEISMIFQQFNLLSQRTVLKNVELVGELNKDNNAHEKAIHYLKLVGLEDKIYAYPSTLSGGQQQRVAIARALMSNPKILLCDEATSALDVDTTESILSLLKELNKTLGLTIIIIAHQMSVIESICNKVAIIDKAKIIEQGYLQDVFLNPQSDIAKKLIYGNTVNIELNDKDLIRIKFNGEVDTPLISDIIKKLNITVSIIHANTKTIDGRIYGQIVIKIIDFDKNISKLSRYLQKNKFEFEEVK